MAPGRQKSRTYRRVKVRTPGGDVRIHYRKKKPSKSICAVCKAPLSGMPRERPIKMQKMAKSKKIPTRPYAGNLCSKCTRLVMRRKGRKLFS